LAGAFYQTAFFESLSNRAISRRLLVEAILRCNAVGKPAWADELNVTRKLTHKNGTLEPVVAVTNSVEEGLADDFLIERWDVMHEEALLVMLEVVPSVYELPDAVVDEEKPLAKVLALLTGNGGFGRTVFKDDFGVGEKLCQCLASAQEDEGCVGHLPCAHEIGVREELMGRKVCKGLVLRLFEPAAPELLDSGGIKMLLGCSRANSSGEIGLGFIEDGLKTVLAHGGEAFADTHPVHAVRPYSLTSRTRGGLEDENPTIRMEQFVDLDAEPEMLIEIVLDTGKGREGFCAYNLTWERIADA
jgi:hypothetical protein